MTGEEARELFSEAFEGELPPERKSAFDEALAGDAELRAEYEEFVDTFRTMGRMAESDAAASPDLLAGVQERLRKRSRGRYYRDRFAQRAGPGWVMPLLAIMAAVLVLAVAWYVLQSTVVLEESPRGAAAAEEP